MCFGRCYRRKDGIRQRAARRGPSQQQSLFEECSPEWVEVDLKRVRVERSRQFGGSWLGLTLLHGLGLGELLEAILPSGPDGV